MGGCRCTFRRCPNNSANSPGMHFFHYPLKYRERLNLWLKYANTPEFLDLPLNKARNKVVCETHFRDECFMNYKKDRLVHQAVPTLLRLSNGMVLDFEESDNPEPKFLEPTKEKHLIPPTQSIQSPESEEEYVVETLEEYKSTSRPNFLKKKQTEITLEECKIPTKLTKIAANPKILNIAASSTSKTAPRNPPRTISCTNKSSSGCAKEFNEDLDIIMCKIEPAQNPTDDDCTIVDFNIPEFIDEEQEEQDKIHIPTTEGFCKSYYEEIISKYERKVQELEQELKEKEGTSMAKNTQVEAVSTTRPLASANPGLLTKSQLFNGIRKYLSPSMATLVRMEMFGGPERPWKSDEKQVSIELFKLGESVFNYFRDEWRFRLPSTKDVEQWLSSYGTLEDDEDL